MPATGVRAPARMLVAVRAIAPGGRDAAEERRDDVGDALRHQLLVGIVAVVDLRVGDARGQQRLDRAEQGDRDRRGERACAAWAARCRARRTPGAPAGCRRSACRWSPRRGRAAPTASEATISTTIGPGRRVMRSTRPRRMVLTNARSRSGAWRRRCRGACRAWSSASSAWPVGRDRLRPEPEHGEACATPTAP